MNLKKSNNFWKLKLSICNEKLTMIILKIYIILKNIYCFHLKQY